MSNFSDLPLEVIANIYNFLEIKDIKNAQLTCKQWLNACYISKYSNRTILRLPFVDDTICNMVKNSGRNYKNVHLLYYMENTDTESTIDQDKLIELFSIPNIFNTLQCLIFENFDRNIKIDTFCEILKCLTNLIDLKLIFTYICSEHEKDNIVYLLYYSKIFSKCLSKNLKSLQLEGIDNLLLFCEIKNLRELYMRMVEDFNPLFKPYYSKIIKNNEKTLKILSIECPLIYNFGLTKLFLISNFKLEELYLDVDGINWHNFFTFFEKQPNIIKLSLRGKMEDTEMIHIIKNLPNLEMIDIKFGSKLTDITWFEILKIKNLKKLYYKYNTTDIISSFLPENVNCKMEEFKGSYLADENCLGLTKMFPNLQVLRVLGNNNLSDIGIQSIIKNCQKLIKLSITGTTDTTITDYGFTGINPETREITGVPVSNLGNLQQLSLSNFKISQETLLYGLKLKKLKYLYINFNNPLSNFSSDLHEFEILTKNCPELERLFLLLPPNFEKTELINLIKILIQNLREFKTILFESKTLCSRNLKLSRGNTYFADEDSHYFQVDAGYLCEECQNLKEICTEIFNEIYMYHLLNVSLLCCESLLN